MIIVLHEKLIVVKLVNLAENRCTIYFNFYYDGCIALKKNIILKRKSERMEQRVTNYCECDMEKLFSLINSLFGIKIITMLPEYTSSFTLASTIFIENINIIKMEFSLLGTCGTCLPVNSCVDIDRIMPACTAVFDTFQILSCYVLSGIICKLNKTTCVKDPFTPKFLIFHLASIINIILRIVNLCFSSGVFPTSCKSYIYFL